MSPKKPAKKSGRKLGNKGPTIAKDPLLKAALEKAGSWGKLSDAMGYSAPTQVYRWNQRDEHFTPAIRERVQAFLDGKPVPRPSGNRYNGAAGGKHDKGVLGLAIVNAPQDGPRIQEAADVMGGKTVYRKHYADGSWLLIFHFTAPADLFAFRAWAASRADVVTP